MVVIVMDSGGDSDSDGDGDGDSNVNGDGDGGGDGIAIDSVGDCKKHSFETVPFSMLIYYYQEIKQKKKHV